MSYWIFKLSKQEQYPDDLGKTYVYDNRHSIRVSAGDYFVYLDKRGGSYGFSGHGVVTNVLASSTSTSNPHHARIDRVYTAVLGDFVKYFSPLDIGSASAGGRKNRSALGISDVNKLGWSRSIAQVNPTMYEQIIELAYRRHCIAVTLADSPDYEIPDAWSYVKRRDRLEGFREAVLRRQENTCAICGTTIEEVLDVAHISGYATDVKNRANPANGIALCAFCHRAFDRGIFRLEKDGIVSVAHGIQPDSILRAHLANMSATARLRLLSGIDTDLLRARYA